MDQTDPADVPASSLRNSHTVLWAVLIIAGLAGLSWVGYLVYKRTQGAPPVPTVVEAAPPAPEPTGPAVNVDDGDAVMAEAAKGLTGAPEATGWLAEPGMLRRLVASVWQVSAGESPREPLRFLAPHAEYSVIARDGHLFQSPESEARYDSVAKAIGAVDAAQAGVVYRRARRFADAAFKEIAPAHTAFTSAVDTALERLKAVPLIDEPIEVVPVEKGVGYRFADPGLERLDATQKHLLRMGTVNARIVLQKLTAFREAAR